MLYRFVNAHIERRTNPSISRENLVKIGSITLEFEKEVCGIFASTEQKTKQKLAYLTEYLSNYWTDFYRNGL